MSELKLIVGLGNPGGQYEYTRHNLGFLVIDNVVQGLRMSLKASPDCKGYIAEGELDNSAFMLLRPATFMNNSGLAVKQLIEKKNIDLSQVLVVCDDVNLDFGVMRVRRRGSDGGHNGLGSIIEQLNSQDFPRLRMGVGQPGHKSDMVDYVLQEFSREEKSRLDDFVASAALCCREWLTRDIEQVMSQYNTR